MSNPMENKSLVNSSEEFRIRGWEIQPYMEKEGVLDYGSPVLLCELAQILKRMVSESLPKMKPPKQKIEIIYSYEKAAMVVTSVANDHNNQGPRKRGRPTTSILVKELAISFELPNDCIAKNLDMDKVALSYRNSFREEGNIISAPQFSFKERLEGWYIESRQRRTNICDTFYRHTKSKRSFRSIVEVVKFLLYETYPCSKKVNKRTPADIQDKHMNIAGASPMIKGETKPTFSGDDKEEQEEMHYKMLVKKIFENSYRNAMDFDLDDEDTCNEEDMWESEYYQEISSDDEEIKNHKGIEESETVEDMLETMYNGLHNISIEKTKSISMMNNEEEKRNGAKNAITEEGGEDEKETQQVVQYHELDEVSAAQVLLNLKNGRIEHKQERSRFSEFQKISMDYWAEYNKGMFGANFYYDLKHHMPASKSIHELAQFLINFEGQAHTSSCTSHAGRSVQISK